MEPRFTPPPLVVIFTASPSIIEGVTVQLVLLPTIEMLTCWSDGLLVHVEAASADADVAPKTITERAAKQVLMARSPEAVGRTDESNLTDSNGMQIPPRQKTNEIVMNGVGAVKSHE